MVLICVEIHALQSKFGVSFLLLLSFFLIHFVYHRLLPLCFRGESCSFCSNELEFLCAFDSFPYVLIIFVALSEEDNLCRKHKLSAEVDINLSSVFHRSCSGFNNQKNCEGVNTKYSKYLILYLFNFLYTMLLELINLCYDFRSYKLY